MILGDFVLSGSKQVLIKQHRDGFLSVSFPEELARAHPGEVRRAGEQAIEELSRTKPTHCLVDLSALQTLGSSCVAAIVRIWKSISAYEGQMVVVAPSAQAREVLRITGLNNVWLIASSMEAGIHSLGFSKEAKVVKRERRLLVMVSFFSLLNAAAAVTIRMLPQLEGYRHPNNTLVASILGLTVLTSTICLFRERGWRLWISIVVFLASLTLSGVFIWHTHYRPRISQPPGSIENSEQAFEQPGDVPSEMGEQTEEPSAASEAADVQVRRIPPLFGKPRTRSDNPPAPPSDSKLGGSDATIGSDESGDK